MEMLSAPVAAQQLRHLVVAVVATGVVGPQANPHSWLELQRADTQAAVAAQASQLPQHFLLRIVARLPE
jgi:hypothetical protein